MMAVAVSAANNCSYCQIHHKQALLNYWKDEEQVNQLEKDYKAIALSKIDLAFDLAYFLTTAPGDGRVEQLIEKLKQLGLDDRAILDAHLVISYFNFVNRMVLGLGVALEAIREKDIDTNCL